MFESGKNRFNRFCRFVILDIDHRCKIGKFIKYKVSSHKPFYMVMLKLLYSMKDQLKLFFVYIQTYRVIKEEFIDKLVRNFLGVIQ